MLPTLFEIPLPVLTLRLAPVFAFVAITSLGFLLAGWRRRAADWVLLGIAGAAAAALCAALWRGQTLTLGPIAVYSYGALLCLSLLVGWVLTLGLAEHDGIPRETAASCFVVTLLSGLVGARALYVATNASDFPTLSAALALGRGGYAGFGALLGGVIGAGWFARRKGQSLLAFADAASPALGAGVLLTRVGCYLHGCDFGKPLRDGAPGWLAGLGTFPRWAADARVPGAGSPAWLWHVSARGLSADATSSLPVHPSQLYEALAGALLIVLAITIRRRRTFRGQAFLALLFAHGAGTVVLGAFRDDPDRGLVGPSLPAHVFMTGLLLTLAAAYCTGPARGLMNTKVRLATQALALLPALVSYLWLRPGHGVAAKWQLSTWQWLGLATAIVVSALWRRFQDAPGDKSEPDAGACEEPA